MSTVNQGEVEQDLLTRKDFLRLAGLGGAGFVASELGLFNLDLILKNETGSETAFQIELPENTHLESVPKGGYLTTSYDLVRLVRMNGNPESLGKFKNTQFIWAPGKIGGETQATKETLDFLKKQMVARAVGEYNSEDDSGWRPDDQEVIQDLLHPVVERVSAFFGNQPLLVTGFVPVHRPGREERDGLRQLFANVEASPGGLFGNIGNSQVHYECGEGVKVACKVDGSGIFSIAIMFDDLYVDGLKKASPEYLTYLQATLGHEYAHGFIGPLQLPPFDNHHMVDLAGRSFYFDRLKGRDVSKEELLFDNLATNMEAYPWMLVKTLTGEDFYAKLLKLLTDKYGMTKGLKFNKEQVIRAANQIFREAKSPFSFETMLAAVDREPAAYVDYPYFPMTSEYSIDPKIVDRIKADPDNTEGIVSWWLPMLWPVPLTEHSKVQHAWVHDPRTPYPRADGYHLNFTFQGNRKISDGPPMGNRLSMAVWKSGGRWEQPGKDADHDYWFRPNDPEAQRLVIEKR